MATAVAAMLEHRFNGDDESPYLIYISMGPTTRRTNKTFGWTLLSRDEHRRFLGESLFAALPPSDDEDAPCAYCNNSEFNFSINNDGETVV